MIRLRRHIGYAIQEAGLFPHYTVRENVALVPRLEKWDAARIAARVRRSCSWSGCQYEEFADRYPDELSGGQRQRVGLARALAADPPILLMDEPFGALDPITRAEMQQEFQKLSRSLGKTVVFVTHDVAEALMLGDRIAVMDAGGSKGSYTPAGVSALRRTGLCAITSGISASPCRARINLNRELSAMSTRI